jgi:hypothetical protein
MTEREPKMSEIADKAAREIIEQIPLIRDLLDSERTEIAEVVERAIAESRSPERSLTELRRLADEALDLSRVEIKSRGPVNWADLHVIEVAEVIPDFGNKYFIVRIEEASPDANELQRFIGNSLAAKGWSGVEVLTEW